MEKTIIFFDMPGTAVQRDSRKKQNAFSEPVSTWVEAFCKYQPEPGGVLLVTCNGVKYRMTFDIDWMSQHTELDENGDVTHYVRAHKVEVVDLNTVNDKAFEF